MKKFLAVAAVAAFAQFGFAEGEPEGEVLGEFLYQTRTGVVVTVEVAADSVRTLAAMPYGRGKGTKIVKTGPGKLIIKDLRNYPGQVIVEAGAIRIGDIDEDVGESEVCDIQNLSLANGTEVEVAEGKTARIAGIDFSTRFTKSGGGTLEIVNTANKRLVNVKLTGGSIIYVNEPTVSSLAQLAAGPSFHLDANDLNSFEFSSGTTISKWYDAKGVKYAGKAAGSPKLVVGATTNQTTGAELNAVSFGGFRDSSRVKFSEAAHGVRTAFVVAAKGGSNQIGMLLGTAPNWCLDSANSPDTAKDIADFKYGTDTSGWPNRAFEADTSRNYTVRNSATCGTTTYYYDGAEGGTTSGETTDPKNVPAPTSTQNYILHEIRLPVGAHVSSLAGWGANYLHSGGWRYGEVILYERELTARERIATRNYLAKKWLGKTDAELTPLPDAPADPDPFVLPEYEAEDGGTLAVAAGETFWTSLFTGSGAFTKDGEGTLAVKDFVGYDGTLTVAAGTLKLTGERPAYEPVDPATLDPALHFDASAAESFTYIDESKRTFSAWASKNGAGVSAKRKLNSTSSGMSVKSSEDLGGKDYVYFQTGAHFRDDATGVTNTYCVKTMVMLVGSQRGGGMLLGGNETALKDPFFRGPNNYGGVASDPILWSGSGATEPARHGEFYLNFERLANSMSAYGNAGVRDPGVVGLSGGWDVVGFRASDSNLSTHKPMCQGLAYESEPAHGRDGRQNLAEVAIWTNILNAADVQGMGVYLKLKWNQAPTWERSRVNGLALDVAEGATLDLGGTTQYVKTLTGAGTVRNGTLCLGEIALDCTEPCEMAVSLDLSDTAKITVGNLAQAEIGSKTTLLTAPSITGTLEGAEIVYPDGVPPTVEATLSVEDGALVLTVSQKAYVKTLAPADGSSVPVAAACMTAVDYVVGEGSFTKTGAGTLAAKDVVGYTGVVAVAEGTLTLTGERPPYEPAMPDSTDLVLHLDAADLSTFVTTNVGGRALIKSWRSKTPNGWKAVPRLSTYPSNRARLEADATLGGAPTVRIPDNGSRGMAFYDADGNRVASTNVQSALWILGSQEGGGFLFGQELDNGVKASDGWHRGEGGYGGNATDAIFYSGAFDGVRTAEMYVNDLRLCDSDNWPKRKSDRTPQNTGLSGGWDFISLRVWKNVYAYKVAADGLAFHTSDPSGRSGKQRLAEVLIYERQLTETETFKAGAYLRVKWGLEPTWQRSRVNAFGVSVAADATLDLGGSTKYVKSLGGAGTVANGTVVADELVLDAIAAAPLGLTATLDLSETTRISVRNVAATPVGTKTLLAATEVKGTLDGIEIVGLTDGMPPTRSVTLTLEDNALVLTVFQVPWLKTLAPADGSSVLVPVGETTLADFVVGEGAFTKIGAGALGLKDLVGYTGIVAVAEGTLKLTGVLPPVEPAMPSAENCVMHLDASDLDSLTLVEQGGKTYVSEWRSQTPNGWRVTPTAGSVASYPIFAPDSDLAYDAGSVRIQNSTGMWFRDADGNKVMTTNVLSAIWILGSQVGGGFLLGTSQTYNGRKSHFFRGAHGGDYGSNPNDYLFYEGAADGVRTMEMYVNDKHLCGSKGWPCGELPDTPMNTGLSGKWDYIFGRVQDWNYRNKVAADSLAYNPDTSLRSGHQRLAELMVFERVVPAAEERAASAYLRVKWGLEPTWQRSQTNGFGVDVAGDATLDLGGTNQYLRVIGGAGSVVNGDLTAAELVASPAGPLSVSGSFTAADDFTVDLRQLPAGLDGEITILTAAGGIVNGTAIRSATVVSDEYPEARAHVRSGTVFVRLKPLGALLIVR